MADFCTGALTAIGALGLELVVDRIAMRPGKPVRAGMLGEKLLLGLPGNPFAAAVTLEFVAMPAIRKMAGAARRRDEIVVVADFGHAKRLGVHEFVPVELGTCQLSGLRTCRKLGVGSSASLRPLAVADGIAVLEPDRERISPGDRVTVRPFGNA